MHNTRIHGLRSLRLRATLLAWLPVVIAIVGACGNGNGSSY